jgi:hypothetical protein
MPEPEAMQTSEAIKDLLTELLQEVRSIKKAISEPHLTYAEVCALASTYEKKVEEADQQGHPEQATLYQGTLSAMRKYQSKMIEYIVEQIVNELGSKPTNSNQAGDISVEVDAP